MGRVSALVLFSPRYRMVKRQSSPTSVSLLTSMKGHTVSLAKNILLSFMFYKHSIRIFTVTVRTDNAAVSWMRNLKNPTGQTARWLQELGTYNLTVVHRSGTQHRNADAMSRRPCTKCLKQQSGNNIDDDDNDDEELTENPSADVHVTRVVTRSKAAEISGCKPTMGLLSNWAPSELLQEQMLDPSLNFIISALQTSNRPSWQDVSEKSSTVTVKTLWRMWDRLSIEKGYLTRLWFEGQQCVSDQFIVPSYSKSDVLYHFHDIPSDGHLGAEKTLGKIRQTFYCPNIKDDVEKYCSKCTLCCTQEAETCKIASWKQCCARSNGTHSC